MKARIILFCAAFAAIVSCAKQEAETAPEASKAYEYTFTLASDTKAAFAGDHIAWTEGDKVGWFAGSSLKEGNSSINLSTTPRSFKISLDSPLSAGDKFYAYAPFSSAGKSASALKLSIPSEQDGASAMPMVSVPVTLSKDIAAGSAASAGEVRFLNLGSVVLFNIYTTDDAHAGETVTGVRFDASGAIAGEGTIDLTKVDPAKPATLALSGLTGTSVTASASGAPGTQASPLQVYMVVAPGTFSGTITVITDKASYAYTLSEEMVFARNGLKPFSVDLASGQASQSDLGEYEKLLTAKTWVLKGVKESGKSCATSTGNKLTLNDDEDHTLSFDCSANGGKTYDHTWEAGLIAPDAYGDVSAMSWWVYSYDGKVCLTISSGFLLVFVQDDAEGEYIIQELTEEKLTVDIVSYDETWTLLFEAEGSSSGSSVEDLLTAHEWVLKGYEVDWNYGAGLEDAVEGATVGNILKFNPDKTLSFDCSANGGKTHDYNFVGEDFEPYSVNEMSWTLGDNDQMLIFPAGSFPLIILGEGEMSFDIEELTDEKLVLTCVLWDSFPAAITFKAAGSSSGGDSPVEDLLTSHSWVLTGVQEEGVDVTTTVGNKLTLNKDYSLSFDCSANGGKTFDHTWNGELIDPDAHGAISSMEWCTYEEGGISYIGVSSGYLLVFAQDSEDWGAYEIKELTDSKLTVTVVAWGETWTLLFEATPD